MNYILVNLAAGRRDKIFGVQKAPVGGKKAILRGRQKIVSNLFFLDTQVFGGGPKNHQGSLIYVVYHLSQNSGIQ